ncbi:hypothetical protein ACJX0J_021960, partial [Zea mays]
NYALNFLLYPTPKSLENHNSLTVTPNLVILEPTISLRYIEHYYAVCSYVWLNAYILFEVRASGDGNCQ